MKRFADLLDRLTITPGRNDKLRLVEGYLRAAPDPDRGYGLAAITRDLDLKTVKPALLRELAAERIDAELFALSYDYVGDLAETLSLIWEPAGPPADPGLAETIERLNAAPRGQARPLMRDLLDSLGQSERYALLKLATGGMRVGVSARMAKQALAPLGGVDVAEIEELWHGLTPPYESLFAWLEGRADKPEQAAAAPFRPVMLATPLEEKDRPLLTPTDYAAEWKWDGIRVQAAAEGGERRLYSRTGDDISRAFPDVVAHMGFEGAIDGELLVRAPDGGVAPFSDLQQRLNRKTVSKAVMERHPAFIRAYDLLQDGAENLRPAPFSDRRTRLEAFADNLNPERFDISPLVDFADAATLAALRAAPPDPAIEGLMLKSWDSPYVPGRPKGPWFKWKKDPHVIDAVLMYAQRGHGRRSSFYSDYTFGVWKGEELVPVGKAYFGFTDEELKQLDRFVRENTVDRFGPVRSVRATRDFGLVLEIAFEGLNRSKRHKSGVAMRFPRISRIRTDKPAAEADRLETLEAMLPEPL